MSELQETHFSFKRIGRDRMLDHVKKKTATIGWFILAYVPILNFYWTWRVSKLVANHEEE